MDQLFDRAAAINIYKKGVIAVLAIENAEDTKPIIESLLEGGVSIIELTFRTNATVDALKIIKKGYSDIIIGMGTVLNPEQVKIAKGEGASFAVAPGTNRKVIEEAIKADLSFGPGITTPSDIETALEYNAELLKFFPAEPIGGLKYLKSINAPYAHLKLKYIPLGGINIHNLEDYFNSPLIGAVGGSWIAPKKMIEEKNWKAIKNNAEEARKLFSKVNKQ